MTMTGIAAVLVLAAGITHFNVEAAFQPPAKAGQPAAVAVTFVPTDPDVYVNEEPAPRLKLDPVQAVLVDRQDPPPPRSPDFDPTAVKTLDLSKPVKFPVALGTAAPRGAHHVKATVVYFYCSKREAWCKRGTADLEVEVTVK
jgi:hypothetical protein